MTSPYLKREANIVRMARVLQAVDDLSNEHHRRLAYSYIGVSEKKINKYDAAAVARETIRRSIYNMEQKNAPLHRKRPVAVDIVENQTPERVLVRRPASA